MLFRRLITGNSKTSSTKTSLVRCRTQEARGDVAVAGTLGSLWMQACLVLSRLRRVPTEHCCHEYRGCHQWGCMLTSWPVTVAGQEQHKKGNAIMDKRKAIELPALQSWHIYTPPKQQSWRGGSILVSPCPSVRPSVHPSYMAWKNQSSYRLKLHLIPFMVSYYNIDGLVQERRNSSALAMELRLSCTNPSILWYDAMKGILMA